MSSNFTVIYDACVLYPAPLRDLLMRLALKNPPKTANKYLDTLLRQGLTQTVGQERGLSQKMTEKHPHSKNPYERIFLYLQIKLKNGLI